MNIPVINQAQTFGLMFCFLFPLQRGAAQFVQISAEVELIGHRVGETDVKAKPRIISLVCITGTNEWRIEHDFLRGGEVKWFFDGTNVYNSIQATTPMSEEMQEKIQKATRLATVPFERAKSNLTINIWPSSDGHPLGDRGANIAWLAFCSGTYLKRQGRLIPLPVGTLHHTPDRFAYSDKTKTFDDESGLPRIIDLFTSKSLYQSSTDDFDKEYFFRDRYAEYHKTVISNLQEDVLTFHYAVTESTNFLGRIFPTKFDFFQNGREHIQNGDWFWRGAGRVKSIRAAAKPKSLFVPSMQQTIVDRRFRDNAKKVDALTYTSTNAFTTPTNDPVLQEKFKKQVEEVQ